MTHPSQERSTRTVTPTRSPDHDDRDAQVWGEVSPTDGVDQYARESDPFYRPPTGWDSANRHHQGIGTVTPPTTDTHNEGSCDLCTGYHDAEEVAFMNKRRTPPTTDNEPADTTIGQMQERLAAAMGCPLDDTYPHCSHGGDAWEYARHLIRDGFVIVPFAAERASGGLDWREVQNTLLRAILAEFPDATAGQLDRIIDSATPQPGEPLICECGHHAVDHDEDGCLCGCEQFVTPQPGEDR